MIKTIDTSQITEEMFKAFRLGDDLSGKIFNLLEAAPEVKTRPIGTLFLGGIEGNEYGEIDVDLKSKALEALQEELVSSENPVVLEVYAHPPAVSEGWIRAIDEALVCHHIDVANADDSYAIAKDKLNKMLCVVQDIGAYFAKQEPAQAVPYGWHVTGLSCLMVGEYAERAAKEAAKRCGGTTKAVPLYTVPPAISEPSQAVEPANVETLDAPHPDHAEYIVFEGSTRIVIAPDDYEQLYNAATRRVTPAIDDETRNLGLDLCQALWAYESYMPRSVLRMIEDMKEKLEAGNGN